MNCFTRQGVALALGLVAGASHAHVVLPPGGAAAGSTYRANFIVGHACKGSASTTGLTVRLPAGFALLEAEPRPGWSLVKGADQVTWTANSPADRIAGPAPATFTIVGKLTERPTTLWFPALQRCDAGSSDWAVVADAAGAKSEFPAPRLDVLAAGVAAVDARDAWAQPTLPGQTVSSVFMRLAAPAGARLVSVSTPAGNAAIHEMQMSGDVMRMRELPDGLDLPPAQAVALTPSTRHIMVTGLKQPLPLGAELPVTLHFIDRDGRKGDLVVQVPVSRAPAATAAEHRH